VRARLLVLALALSSSGCLTGVWSRTSRLAPVSGDVVLNLEVEHSTLEHCLETLGAPLYVWEYQGDGLALAYGFYRSNEFGFNLSLPVTDTQSASFDYEDERAHLHGYVLFFDDQWKLTEVKAGALRDLERLVTRRRPALPEEERKP
jgi:hypothetical protein